MRTQWLRSTLWDYEAHVGATPMMVRVMDVVGALMDLPIAADGELVCAVTDEQCGWNTGRFKLTAQDGRLVVARASEAADVQLTIQGLSALAYGALSVAEVVHRGWLTMPPAAASLPVVETAYTLLDSWFPECTIYNRSLKLRQTCTNHV